MTEVSSWPPPGLLLASYWPPPGLLLASSWPPQQPWGSPLEHASPALSATEAGVEEGHHRPSRQGFMQSHFYLTDAPTLPHRNHAHQLYEFNITDRRDKRLFFLSFFLFLSLSPSLSVCVLGEGGDYCLLVQ